MSSVFFVKESLKDVEFSSMYSIGKELGKGPTAVVHKCEQRGTGPWAVKIIPKNQIKRKVKDVEVGALLRLKHSNVIRLREVYETPERIYLVCQLETGGDLLDRVVTHGIYTEQDIAKCIRSVLRGLAYLHENEIAHRNIKPENLLYDSSLESNILKIADYGVCQVIGHEVQKHAVCHMPGYVAPEILQGEVGDQSSDIWSVGVIAFLLLSGVEPFSCEDSQETYKRIIKGQYSMDGLEWTGVTDNAKDLVRKLLVLEPCRRMTAKDSLIHLWVRGEASGEEHMEDTQTRLKQLNLKRKAQRVVTDFFIPESELPVPEPEVVPETEASNDVPEEEAQPEQEVAEEVKPVQNESQPMAVQLQF